MEPPQPNTIVTSRKTGQISENQRRENFCEEVYRVVRPHFRTACVVLTWNPRLRLRVGQEDAFPVCEELCQAGHEV